MPDAATPVTTRRSGWRFAWGLFVFLIAIGGLGASAYLYRRLQRTEAARDALATEVAAFGPRFEQFKEAVRGVDRQLAATVFQEIDLGATGWQPIAGGFYVIDLAVAPAGKGTKIAGKIINPTSVVHESAQFSVRIGEKRATFSLPRVPPGIAQTFDVTLPDVAAASVKRAFFALDGSTISFSSSTTRKRPGPDPVDTDKLLR
jgi:NAD(P)-dependent dehydrogenase (short-subunit alcohol dehydrogenase family)